MLARRYVPRTRILILISEQEENRYTCSVFITQNQANNSKKTNISKPGVESDFPR